jgi:hypothetical protein
MILSASDVLPFLHLRLFITEWIVIIYYPTDAFIFNWDKHKFVVSESQMKNTDKIG